MSYTFCDFIFYNFHQISSSFITINVISAKLQHSEQYAFIQVVDMPRFHWRFCSFSGRVLAARLIQSLNPGFDEMFSSWGEKRTCGNVHIWFCVPTIWSKHIWFQNFPSFVLYYLQNFNILFRKWRTRTCI